MAKSQEKIKARSLRRQGRSINEIAKLVNATKRSISLWCHDIKLSKEQEEKLWQRAKIRRVKNFKKYCERKKRKTEEKIKKLHLKGIKSLGNLSPRELFIAGIALYWAEGFKKSHQVGFANSDPKMIEFHLKWLKECLNIPLKKVRARISLNISHRKRAKEVKKYWQKITGLSKSQFNKTFYQKTKWKKQFENSQDYYGVLQLRINKIDLLRKIQGMITGLKNQVEIDFKSKIG